MSETNNLKLKKHDNPETNEEQFDIENYLNVNWDKLEEFATNVDGKVIEIEDNIEEINKKDTEQDNKIVELQNEKTELEKELKEIQEDFYQSSIRGQASGEYIHVEDSSGARCKIGIGGNHKQETYSGKNLFKVNISTSTINGITITELLDGGFLLNGTATANAIFRTILDTDLEGTYTLSLQSTSATEKVILSLRSESGTQLLSIRDTKVSVKSTYTTTSPIKMLDLQILEGAVLSNLKVYPMLATEDISFEKYVGGIPAPNPDYPSEIKTAGSNVNLFDITKYDYRNLAGANIQINNKTDFRVNATMNNNANCAIGFKIMDLTKYAGKILTVKSYVKSSTSTNKAFLVLRQNNSDYTGTKTNELFDESQNTTNGVITLKYKVTDTINDSNRYLFIWFYANRGTTCNIGDYIDYKVKLVTGTEIGEYSKYGQGAVKVTKCNKNIFDGKLELGRWSFSTGNAQEYANYVRSKNAILVKPNTIYTASCDVSGLTLSFTQFDENMNFINALPNQQATYKNCKYIKININDTTNVDLKVQLEECSIATIYEPHQEQSYIIPTQQAFKSIGNTRDTFIKKDGKWNERHYITRKIFDGSDIDGWAYRSDDKLIATEMLKNIAIIPSSNYEKAQILCNYFIVEKRIGAEVKTGIIGINELGSLFIYNNYNSLTEFKTWLKEKYDERNPMYVDYISKTPTDIECTEEQKTVLDEIEKARTYKNVTNIYTTDEVSPIIELDYAKDLETLINNVQALALSNVSEEV